MNDLGVHGKCCWLMKGQTVFLGLVAWARVLLHLCVDLPLVTLYTCFPTDGCRGPASLPAAIQVYSNSEAEVPGRGCSSGNFRSSVAAAPPLAARLSCCEQLRRLLPLEPANPALS